MEIKVRAGNVWSKITMTVRPHGGEKRIYLSFPYNPALIRFARSMSHARWDPIGKMWHGAWDVRTEFRMRLAKHQVNGEWISQDNPYAPWRHDEYPELDDKYPYMPHQRVAIQKGLASRCMIWAQEPRTGKTLQGIRVMEVLGGNDTWWVSNRSGLAGVKVDFRKWGTDLKCDFMTYEELIRRMVNWDGSTAPTGLILDEVHKAKNPETKRTNAVRDIVKGMRADHGNPPVIAMSGTMAPKDPTDWWSPVEIIQPGYIQENGLRDLRKRLGLVYYEESMQGGMFPRLLTWFDNPEKCTICGRLESGFAHKEDDKLPNTPGIHNTNTYANTKDQQHYKKPHKFEPSIDEIRSFGKRLQGMVHTQYFKDCEMDLPDLQDEYWYYNNGWQLTMDLAELDIKPEKNFKELTTHITKNSAHAAIRDMRLRELSDGFQYVYEEIDETETCPECKGAGECMQFDELQDEVLDSCWKCDGTGECNKVIRKGERIPTPKDDKLRDDLEEFESSGRLIVFTAFTESTDRVVEICLDEGWSVIRVDGRGWSYHGEHYFNSDEDALEAFANPEKFPKIVWAGHPRSGGMGISLSASRCVIFYSNSDASDDKQQGRKRGHDLGMDTKKGGVVREYFHMEADVKAIHRYLKKVDLYDKVAGAK